MTQLEKDIDRLLGAHSLEARQARCVRAVLNLACFDYFGVYSVADATDRLDRNVRRAADLRSDVPLPVARAIDATLAHCAIKHSGAKGPSIHFSDDAQLLPCARTSSPLVSTACAPVTVSDDARLPPCACTSSPPVSSACALVTVSDDAPLLPRHIPSPSLRVGSSTLQERIRFLHQNIIRFFV